MAFSKTAFLRFADEAEWETVAQALGVLVVTTPEETEENPNPEPKKLWFYYTSQWAVDVVGVLYNDDAVIDPDTGEVITPATPMDGWHVNAKWNDSISFPTNFSDHTVHPAQPRRIFLGDDMAAIAADAAAHNGA